MNESEVTNTQPKINSKKIKQPHPLIYIIGGVVGLVLLILGLVIAWWWFIQPAFVIDGHSTSKATYFNMMASAKKSGITQADATTQYINIEKQRVAAQKLNLIPTPNQTSNAQANTYPSTLGQNLSIWQLEVSYANSLSPTIQFATIGGYSGAYFRFPFTQHLEALPFQYVSGEKPKPTGWRDPKYIADDKAYSYEVAQKDHEKIKNGASAEQIIKEIQADPRLARLGAANGSLVFTINQKSINFLGSGINQDLSSRFDQSILQKDKTVKLTDILTGKITLQDLPGRPEVEGYYYFLQIDSYKDPNPTIQKQFDETVNSLKVEKHV